MAPPRKKTTAAKTKPTANKPQWTKEEMVYLSGIWTYSQGLKSVGNVQAVAISPAQFPEWPEFLAETYGGDHHPFTSNAGKTFNGWYVDLDLRLKFLNELEKAGTLKGVHTNWRDGVRGKLDKAIRKEKES